jgi:hypothetical protein
MHHHLAWHTHGQETRLDTRLSRSDMSLRDATGEADMVARLEGHLHTWQCQEPISYPLVRVSPTYRLYELNPPSLVDARHFTAGPST